jgi:inner membrane protein
LRFISVVDVAFTLPLLAAVILGVRRASTAIVRWGLAFAASYLALGAFQNARASALQAKLAEDRGHTIERGQVFPTFTNDVAWRSLYQAQGRYYIDKLRVTLTGKACVTPGTSVELLPEATPGPGAGVGLHPASARAHQLIHWFSGGWVALDPEDPSVIGDLRYSFTPTEAAPIWGVRIDDHSGKVEWVNNRSKRAVTLHHFIELVMNDGERHRCY